ncbi:metalloregulator ArsR/SmtB family transcription factor [candidate division KSB3 bacterium]|uniref:Metalloregulator ArsR/SmtB family transcription factor n=1 Tax=candidate division KSB3 bacterium TaxID=2044937 RepID=A0A9D5JTP2_9BACT|nr:metalloregulator ArsR/SmtB family transcription factor [candidate division KSB3 bacterium]MBD3324032.1 metalloregulator ArsR/SmtB family transcription factor [candidate division KSB3 bacterium]
MQEDVVQMAEFFKALGDPTRLKILRLLTSYPERKLCVGAIAQRLGITQPAVSQHLKVLKHVRLVEPNREGYRVHYAVNRDTMEVWKEQWDELNRSGVEQAPCEGDCEE